MNWLQRYRIRQYLRNSVWVLPSLGIVMALVAARIVHDVDMALGWQSEHSPEAVRTVLGTLASAMFTFIVFVSSTLLIALQLASAQLTPRIIAFVFRDPITKYSLALFVFIFSFTLKAVLRVDDNVPVLTARLAAYGCVLGLVVFFFLLDHVCRRLRPGEALRAVAIQGHEVIESIYPRPLGKKSSTPVIWNEGEQSFSIPAPRDGVLLACNVGGIVSIAQRADCVLQMVPQVGDFVAAGSPLFNVDGDGSRIPADELSHLVAIGPERSMEQDPAFAFRIMVDIASKALSPAINDPTTAVLAIDQIHYLLNDVGRRDLDDERVRDSAGRVRLIYRTPNWDDFVRLAITEIRHFGCESIQVARRLRSMIKNLMATLPQERAEHLGRELSLLQRSAARFFTETEDRELATVGDSQGMGGRSSQEEATEAISKQN